MAKGINDMANKLFRVRFWALVSLTLGLAPFVPEPHIWGKLKWIAGGADGMQVMDWFDTAMHGLPWVFLIISLFIEIKQKAFSYG